MKKIGLFLLSALTSLCLLTACGGDDEEKKPEIIGKWKYKSTVVEVVKTTPSDAAALINTYLSQGGDETIKYRTLEITDDGLVLGDNEFVGTVSYSVDNYIISFLEGIVPSQVKVIDNDLVVWLDETKNIEFKRNEIGLAEDVKIEKVVIRESYSAQ